MNFYNNIQKYKYEEQEKGIVSLKEYVTFTDDRTGKKYTVFKFCNNQQQKLFEVHFQVEEYDSKGELIARSVIRHSNFCADSNETFVPNAKYETSYSCEKISVQIVYARFELLIWQNGEFTKIPYDLNEYKTESKEAKTNKQLRKELLSKQRQLERARKQCSKREEKLFEDESKLYRLEEKSPSKKEIRKSFKVKSDYRRNKLPFLRGLSIFCTIIFTLVFAVSAFYYSMKPTQFISDEYVVESTSYTTGKLTDYLGTNSTIALDECTVTVTALNDTNAMWKQFLINLEIEEGEIHEIELFNYKQYTIPITAVGKSAFLGNKKVSTVTFARDNITIDASAFENCTKLSSIEFDKISTVGNYAFKNSAFSKVESNTITSIGAGAFQQASYLRTVTLQSCVTVGEGAFADCSALTRVDISSCSNVQKKTFYNCPSLTQVNIGRPDSSIKTLGELFGCLNSQIHSIQIYMNGVTANMYEASFWEDVPSGVKVYVNGSLFQLENNQ